MAKYFHSQKSLTSLTNLEILLPSPFPTLQMKVLSKTRLSRDSWATLLLISFILKTCLLCLALCYLQDRNIFYLGFHP